MTTAVIVQARMTSTRFPGKVLADLCGKPVLWHVLVRALQIPDVDHVILAVPDDPVNDTLELVAKPLQVRVWRGSESDVLSRYLGAARSVHADYIMRLTADCPLIDPHVCDQVLSILTQPLGANYVSNVLPRTFEQGLDCEAFTRWTLELAARHATEPYDREHVTPWMQRAPILNRVNVESGEPGRAETNWCIDYPIDLEIVRRVMAERQAA